MTDEAEWIDVDREFGVRPAPPPRRGTERPFWLTPGIPGPLDPPTSTLGYPWRPGPTPHTPHDAPEVMAPGSEHSNEVLAITMGALGGLMGLLLLGLLLYMIVLRRRLSEAKSSKAREDYSIRVTDVAHLSSSLDDSSQLYANTSDLHKIIHSARMSRKNPPPLPSVGNSNSRPLPPPPGEADNVLMLQSSSVSLRKSSKKKFNPSETVTDARNSVVNGFKRLSERFGNNVTLPSLWNQSKKNELHQKSTETVITMPEVVNAGVPEVLDDDDLWSEDSFDSCSIDYEDEVVAPSRVPSVRHSRRSINRSKRFQKSTSPNKPSVPPPAPPNSDAIYGNSDIEHFTNKPLPAPPSNPKPPSTPVQYQKPVLPLNSKPIKPLVPSVKPQPPSNLKPVGVVRPAPPVPSIRSSSNNSGPNSLSSENSCGNNYDVIEDPTPVKSGGPPPLPFLPKPKGGKPAPPVTPKPLAKPHLLPKLKIGLSVPSSRSENTPDTTTTLLSSTPGLEESNRFISRTTKPTSGEANSPTEPSNLSVSARKALLEGKSVIGKK